MVQKKQRKYVGIVNTEFQHIKLPQLLVLFLNLSGNFLWSQKVRPGRQNMDSPFFSPQLQQVWYPAICGYLTPTKFQAGLLDLAYIGTSVCTSAVCTKYLLLK